jgi:peptidoglycan biosynthesis protein MviN/MurJ (putative lipid II flippase)
MTLAAHYGVGAVSDTLIIAFTIPDLLLVFINGAVAASFIPMYHRVEDRIKFTRNIMICLVLIDLAFSIVFTLFPGVLVRLLAFQICPENSRSLYFYAVHGVVGDIYAPHRCL